jgi:hypothetical protein
VRTRATRYEKMPARTDRVTSFPFTVKRTTAASLTLKRKRRHDSTRNCGATVSTRNRTERVIVPMSLDVVNIAA